MGDFFSHTMALGGVSVSHCLFFSVVTHNLHSVFIWFYNCIPNINLNTGAFQKGCPTIFNVGPGARHEKINFLPFNTKFGTWKVTVEYLECDTHGNSVL